VRGAARAGLRRAGTRRAAARGRRSRRAVTAGDALEGLAGELASYGLASWHHFATKTLEPRVNWKIAVDTFLEAYHLAALHRASVGPIFFGNLCLSDAFGLNHRMVAVRRSFAELASEDAAARDLLRHTIELYTIFPNTVFIHQADHVEVWRMFPKSGRADACKVYLSLYTPEPATTEAARRHWQANIGSGAQEHVTYGRNEPGLIHFHGSLGRALEADPLAAHRDVRSDRS
jgi:hypothetical protein